jgi:hypothetical protein
MYFTEHKIPFTFIDYDLADDATQSMIMDEIDAVGANGFPFVKIGDIVVEGYNPQSYAEALGI